jgi:hypothetical protein
VTLNAKKCFDKPVSYVAVDYDNEYKKPAVRHLCILLLPLGMCRPAWVGAYSHSISLESPSK